MSSSEKPWYTYKAIDWLDKNIQPDWKIFEWGAGASSLYFGDKAEVISIEYDRKYSQFATHLIDLSSDNYVNIIDEYGQFDLIAIDGRRRIECLKKAVPHAKKYILIDNMDRERYKEAYEILKGWSLFNFQGKGARDKTWTTTIWSKPE